MAGLAVLVAQAECPVRGPFPDFGARNPESALPPRAASSVQLVMSEECRYCCKSLFASLNTNFPGRTPGDRIIIGGTTSSSGELTGDFGMAWRLHRSAIAICLVYFREIDPMAFWKFCNTICQQQTRWDCLRIIPDSCGPFLQSCHSNRHGPSVAQGSKADPTISCTAQE